MYCKLDNQRFIKAIAEDPSNSQEAADLKSKGYIEIHPLARWVQYMANFANKFYVDNNNVVHATGNLPITPIQKAFNDVKGQLTDANNSIDNLKSTNSDLVNQINSITNSNKQLANDANQAKSDAQQSAKTIAAVVSQVFQLKSELKGANK